jgi:hypothetical protein
MPIISRLTRMGGQPKRWRYRLRTLLVVVLVVGLGLSWLTRQLRREREQVALVAELDQASIYAWQYEPNSVGWMLQALPISAQQWLVPRWLRWSFCYSPSRISAFSIAEDTVPHLIEKMRRLPYLRSVSFQHGQISPESEETIRKALPSVDVEFDPRIGTFPCKLLSCERCKALRKDLTNPGPVEDRVGLGMPSDVTVLPLSRVDALP